MIGKIRKIKFIWATGRSKSLISYLRSKGVSIGENVHFFGDTRLVRVDTTRPSLVRIGNNVRIVSPFTLLTHGFEWTVFREKYHEILGSCGKVVIGNNVYIGRETCILKGTKIGDNVIIGAKSLVNKDIPSNCVAVGMPAKEIMGIDEYFEKRKKECIEEAKEYAYSIYEVFGRMPVQEDFFEFFPLFLKRDEKSIRDFNERLRRKMKKDNRRVRSIQSQLGPAFGNFINSQPYYESFEAFLMDAGIPVEKGQKNRIFSFLL